MERCATNRGLVKVIFLGLITLGIYDLVVLTRLGKDLNRIKEKLDISGKKLMHFVGALFLSIITLGIPLIIWEIKMPTRIYFYADKTGIKKKGSLLSYFIFTLVLSFTAVFPLIALARLLKTANRVCQWYNDQYVIEAAVGEKAPQLEEQKSEEAPKAISEKQDDEDIIVLKIKNDPSANEKVEEQPKAEEKVEEPVQQEQKPEEVKVEEQPAPAQEEAKEEQPAKKPAEKKAPAAKKENKPAEKKAAPAKKAETKPAAKKAPATKTSAKAEAPKAEKKAPASNAAYHVSKRASDNKWQVKIAGSDKVIKLFNTKPEAEAWVNEKSASTGRSVLVHASKGKNKGRIQ